MKITFQNIENNEVVSEESYRVESYELPIQRTFSSGLTVYVSPRNKINISHIGPPGRDHALVSGPGEKSSDKVDNFGRRVKNFLEFPPTVSFNLQSSQRLRVTSPFFKSTQELIVE
jgi:hypothetical protein